MCWLWHFGQVAVAFIGATLLPTGDGITPSGTLRTRRRLQGVKGIARARSTLASNGNPWVYESIAASNPTPLTPARRHRAYRARGPASATGAQPSFFAARAASSTVTERGFAFRHRSRTVA